MKCAYTLRTRTAAHQRGQQMCALIHFLCATTILLLLLLFLWCSFEHGVSGIWYRSQLPAVGRTLTHCVCALCTQTVRDLFEWRERSKSVFGTFQFLDSTVRPYASDRLAWTALSQHTHIHSHSRASLFLTIFRIKLCRMKTISAYNHVDQCVITRKPKISMGSFNGCCCCCFWCVCVCFHQILLPFFSCKFQWAFV